MNRIDKITYYLNIAEEVSRRSTCRKRHYGAIIVNNDEIISTGFNGSPRKLESCSDTGKCLRQNAERGTDYANCCSVHAEQNAIISSCRKDMIGADLYLVGILCDYFENSVKELNYVDNPSPCSICKRMIINAGIERVILRVSKHSYNVINVKDWTVKDIVGGY